jgi:hypothetical protein
VWTVAQWRLVAPILRWFMADRGHDDLVVPDVASGRR